MLLQVFDGSDEHGFALPVQLVEPVTHSQPTSAPHVAELVFVAQAAGVPSQRPVSTS